MKENVKVRKKHQQESLREDKEEVQRNRNHTCTIIRTVFLTNSRPRHEFLEYHKPRNVSIEILVVATIEWLV
jgi:hypothetical protein